MEDAGVIQNFQHYIRLMMLLDSGCQTLRKIFRSRYQDFTGEEWKDDEECARQFIQNYGKSVYNKSYPDQKQVFEAGNVKKWDMSLLSSILTRIEMVSSSASKEEWTRIVKENQNILDLALVRNKYAHLPEKSLSKSEFTELWDKAFNALQELGADEEEMKNLQSCSNISGIEFQNTTTTTTTTLSEEEEDAKYKELRCQGNDAVKSKDFEKAILLYTKALQLSTLSDVNKGLLYSNRSYATLMAIEKGETPDEIEKQCTLADEDAKLAIKTRPLWFKGYFRQGKVYQYQKNWGMAIRAFNQSLGLNPTAEEVREERDVCRQEEAKVINRVHLDPNALPRSLAEEVEIAKSMDGMILNAAKMMEEHQEMCDSPDPKVASIGWVFMGDRNKNGIDLPLNLEMAARLYAKAAAAGSAEGMYKLGMMHQNGEGLPKDLKEAARLFEKAAAIPVRKTGGNFDRVNFGVSSAQYHLGLCYLNGTGKSKDVSQTVKWFKKAIDNGDETATHGLGNLYYEGLGVPKSIDRAIQYWKLAANKGYLLAMDCLMRHYLEIGDPDAAETWFHLAIKGKNLSTIMIQNEVETRIKELRAQMEDWKSHYGLPKKKMTLDEMHARIAEKHPDVVELNKNLDPIRSNNKKPPLAPSSTLASWDDHILAKCENNKEEIYRRAQNGDTYAENIYTAVTSYLNTIRLLEFYKHDSTNQSLCEEIIRQFSSCVQKFEIITILIPEMLTAMEEIVNRVIVEKMNVKSSLDKDARVCKSRLLVLSSNTEEAVDFLFVCRKKYPKEKYFLQNYCDIVCYVQRFEEGIQVATDGLELFPNDPDLQFSLAGHIKLNNMYGNKKTNKKDKKKHIEELKAAYLKFIEFAPRSHRMLPEAYYTVASLCVNNSLSKQNDKSEKECQKYFEEGLKAEKDVLPCFLPYDESQAKVIVQERKNAQIIKEKQEKMERKTDQGEDEDDDDEDEREVLLTEIQLTDPRRVEIVVGHRMKMKEVITNIKQNPLLPPQGIAFDPRHQQTVPTQLASLKEIVLDDMDPQLDKVYKKNVINLTIIEDSLLVGLPSIHTVVMDKTGRSSMCCLYNMSNERKRELRFGSTLTIVNPYFRLSPMGQTALRIDDPQTVIIHTSGQSKCRFCFKPNPKFRCTKCNRSSYCDRDCQVKDYKLLKHKYICDDTYGAYL